MGVVLITGCSSGFGLETALAFARKGETTYASMRNLARADRLVERARAEGLTVELLTLDVDDDASVATAVSEVEDRHGRIDVLVNNAGVDHTGAVETIDMDRARAVLETNYWGPVRTIRAVLPGMRARRAGVIINVSSASGSMSPGAQIEPRKFASSNIFSMGSRQVALGRGQSASAAMIASRAAANSDRRGFSGKAARAAAHRAAFLFCAGCACKTGSHELRQRDNSSINHSIHSEASVFSKRAF